LRRFLVFAVSAVAFIATPSRGQTSSVKPIQIVSGTILTFHLQTRLRASAGDPLNDFPAGTVLQVKVLDSIEPAVKVADGFPFRGSVVSSLSVGDRVVIHPDAEVRGLQVLLRNRNHPEGFRYELLITSLVDHGESYTVTASFDPTLDGNGIPLSGAETGDSKGVATGQSLATKPSEAATN
jgi:hypothetical protein